MKDRIEESEITRVGVIGAGSWGTALANLLSEKGVEVDLWVREEEILKQIRDTRVNEVFLPEVRLDAQLRPVDSFEQALSRKELVLLAVPSHVFRQVITRIKPFLRPDIPLAAATKGIENKTLMVMSQVAVDVLDEKYMARFACLAGPSFAREVARRRPTAVTIACQDMMHAQRLQRLFSTDFFRVYTSDDVTGCQLGGALKNVMAIAAGASDGLKFGENARAALITRGLAEMTRLGVAMGANPHTFAGLAGLGDLVLTCTGDQSRNRTVGLKVGRGMPLDEVTRSMRMVAEGVKTARSAYELSGKMDVVMPIATEVYRILYEGKDPKDAVRELMVRDLRQEREF
ncbi:MAG: NAD(P)-dependent glycerol-3-phosphate dehydrogenase [Deltaproteobacteria bacterium]|nr:NAD(P)-dependent glycerol-3-phosphate dehydrogenase [Deltaproteobacteria bacterium]